MSAERAAMDQPLYLVDSARRKLTLEALVEACARRGWSLMAAHVRTNHVHIVVEANAMPEKIMKDLKAYASRRLDRSGLDPQSRKRWVRHGSTRYLWKPKQLSTAVRYVIEGQGKPMDVFVAPGENAKNHHSLTVAASEASVPARRVLPGRQRRIHHVSKLLRIRRPGVHIDGSLSAEERAQHLNLG